MISMFFLASSSSNLDPNEQVVTSGCHRQNNAQGKNGLISESVFLL